MTRNTHTDFAGIARIKERHAVQLADFESWAGRDAWMQFHEAHYDWWMFPVDRPSSFGFMWTVYDGDVAEMKTDGAFITRYRRGIELVALAWGWDVSKHGEVSDPQPGQAWADWPIRLYKMTTSAQLFGENDAFESLKKYGRLLIERGCGMQYNGKDLSGVFGR